MRHIILSFMLMTCLCTHAQFKVYSNGGATLGCSSQDTESLFCVGTSPTLNLLPVTIEPIYHSIAGKVSAVNRYNYGVVGFSAPSSLMTSGRTYGVYGMAANCTSGYNYGVYGYLSGTANGAGVYGSATSAYGTIVPGRYAGYFQGSIMVNGTAYLQDIYTPSDLRLKEDISYLGGETCSDIRSRMMEVGVVSYRLKAIDWEVGDTVTSEPVKDETLHYGVIAQELQELFPDLVKERQDGYLSVNYVELVPMLICSLQEMNKELEELHSQLDELAPRNPESQGGSSRDGFMLGQNTPNPATSQTVIMYTVPEGTADAYIYILNLQGMLRKQVPVSYSANSVTVSVSDLEPGFYYYSLVVSGNEIQTRRMIVSR